MPKISSREFGAKFRTKPELERFVQMYLKAFVPHHSVVTVFYYRGLLNGSIKVS